MPNLSDKQEQEAGHNVPKLRFPEFSGEWESRRIGDDCSVLMCKRVFANQTSEQGEVPFYKIGTIGATPDTYISRELFEEYRAKYNYPRKGEVMVTCAGTVGKTIVFNGDDSYYQDSNIVWLSNPKQLYINSFLNYFLSRVNWNKLNSTTITRIYNDNLRELVIEYPSVKEQEKIVSLLSLIDRRIAIQNRVIELYESLIKAIRHNIFKDICGEVISLGNIADIYQPQTISSSDLTTEGYWVYGANGVIGKYKDYNHETEQICITCRGNTCGTVNYTPSQVWITGNSMVINTDRYSKQVYKRFLFHYLSSYNFTSIVSGSGQPQIVRTPLEKIKITLPIIEKQKRIANGLDIMLEKVDTERAVLVILDNQKRYLLRQLFI